MRCAVRQHPYIPVLLPESSPHSEPTPCSGARPASGFPGHAHEPLQPAVVFELSAFATDLGPRIFGQLDWDLGGAHLTSISAWRDNTIAAGNDPDYSAAALVEEPANGNVTDFKQMSEELRLAGKSGRLNWLTAVSPTKSF